jgi:hypothetical protein
MMDRNAPRTMTKKLALLIASLVTRQVGSPLTKMGITLSALSANEALASTSPHRGSAALG